MTSAPRTIRYSFTLSNQGNTALTNGTFCVWAPVKQTPTQSCTNIVTSEPAEILTDELGNQLLVFNAAGIPPYGTKIITIESTLAISPNDVPKAQLTSSPSSRPSLALQLVTPELVREGGSLGVGGTFDLSTFDSSSSSVSPSSRPSLAPHSFSVGGTFDSSSSSVSPSSRPSLAPHSFSVGGTFDSSSSSVSPSSRPLTFDLSTFDSSSSSSPLTDRLTCAEAADLFVSMCISNGIRARRINGYFAPRSMVLRPLRYHSWAEFHDGVSWRICDPQRNIFDTNQSDYIPFTILPDSDRLSTLDSSVSFLYSRFFWLRGNGLKVEMGK